MWGLKGVRLLFVWGVLESHSCRELGKHVFQPSSFQNIQGALSLVLFFVVPLNLACLCNPHTPSLSTGCCAQYFSLKIRPNRSEMGLSNSNCEKWPRVLKQRQRDICPVSPSLAMPPPLWPHSLTSGHLTNPHWGGPSLFFKDLQRRLQNFLWHPTALCNNPHWQNKLLTAQNTHTTAGGSSFLSSPANN